MKKISVILFLLILGSEGYTQEAEFGLKGGMNVTTLGRPELGMQTRLAYHFGGTVEFVTTPFVSIQIELVYSLQGAAIDRSQQIFLNYHYLNVPLFGKAYFYEDASFELGVQYGRMLKAINASYLGNQADEVNKNDFSIVVGLAYKLNDRFNFGLRYNLGISNTADLDIIYEQRYTNRVLQISFGYIL